MVAGLAFVSPRGTSDLGVGRGRCVLVPVLERQSAARWRAHRNPLSRVRLVQLLLLRKGAKKKEQKKEEKVNIIRECGKQLCFAILPRVSQRLFVVRLLSVDNVIPVNVVKLNFHVLLYSTKMRATQPALSLFICTESPPLRFRWRGKCAHASRHFWRDVAKLYSRK